MESNTLKPATTHNTGTAKFSYKTGFPELFEEQVSKTPANVAIVFNDKTLTYNDLNEQSNQVAHFLKDKGVKKEVLVPICIDRTPDMIIWILGILKAGGAFVPIDPQNPKERLAYLLDDTGASLVIMREDNTLKLSVPEDIEVIEIESAWLQMKKNATENLQISIQPNHLAYIIYTSGSTGKPKGVMIEHASLSNYLLSCKGNYTGDEEGGSGSFIHLSYTFDASLTAMFLPLLSGKAVVIASRHGLETFEDDNFWKYAPYDFIKATPAHLEILGATIKDKGKKWVTNRLVLGGEALHGNHLVPFFEKEVDMQVINEYGPTEATVGCTTYYFNTARGKEKLKNGISIGKPIENAGIYILNERNELVSNGTVGEIGIGGAGIARGYLNRPELTSERFIVCSINDLSRERVYKTGDFGKWLPDGNLEYIGRKDDQVKIRGYRVELGEVESAVNNFKDVKSNCVIVKKSKDLDKNLVCFYTLNREILKTKERDLYEVQVANWNGLYEKEYEPAKTAANVDPEFNLRGWSDSFTGKAIPEEQMREWLGDITEVILSEQPQNVLEIGCGMGLIYFQLAGKVKKYIGTDFSKYAIDELTYIINKGKRNYGNTDLKVAAAHEVRLDENEQIDTIILNSIIQYFPGAGYLSDVIEKSIIFLKGRGRIIVGDVRDNRLLKSFHIRKHMEGFNEATPVKEFAWHMDQEVSRDQELCLSPDYFYGLQSRYPEISHVDIQWKQGSHINELTLYRYTVIINIGYEKNYITPDWKTWNKTDKHEIIARLDKGTTVAFQGAPNPRLRNEILFEEMLKDTPGNTLRELKNCLANENEDCNDVNDVISAAKLKGFKCKFLLDKDPLKINLLLQPGICNDCIVQPYGPVPNTIDNSNIPLLSDIYNLVKKELHHYLSSRLPDYMVPSAFIALSDLPLTSNGKVDRLFLSQVKDRKIRKVASFQEPSTQTEKILAKIWMELLSIEQVSIHDDFFELGGNSLQAFRMFSKIKKTFAKNLPLGLVLHASTIEKIAAILPNYKDKTGWSSLVPIQPHGSRPPLFCVHGGFGRVLFYRNLAASLGTDQPLYGLQVKGLNGIDKPYYRLEDMATHYLTEIRSVQPEGPYYIGGYCYGAIVAFEMAQQLIQQDQQVALLANFNGISPVCLFPENFMDVQDVVNASTEINAQVPNTIFSKVSKHIKIYSQLDTKEKLFYHLKQIKHKLVYLHIKLDYARKFGLLKIASKYYLATGQTMPETVLKFYLLDAMGKAQSHYMAKKYPGEMIILRSPKLFEDPHLGWSSLVSGGIKTFDIPGDHPDRTHIFNEPHVHFMAMELNKYLGNKTINK